MQRSIKYSKWQGGQATGAYAALGVEFKLNQQVSFVGEFECYGKSKVYGAKPNVVTVGVKYSF